MYIDHSSSHTSTSITINQTLSKQHARLHSCCEKIAKIDPLVFIVPMACLALAALICPLGLTCTIIAVALASIFLTLLVCVIYDRARTQDKPLLSQEPIYLSSPPQSPLSLCETQPSQKDAKHEAASLALQMIHLDEDELDFLIANL